MNQKQTAIGLVVAAILLGAAGAQAQPATESRDALLSTEDWTAADTNDDDTLSAAELNRAEPSLAAYFGEIDVNGDRRIARDELAAWQADAEPGSTDADELPAGEVDEGDLAPEAADQGANDGDADAARSRSDDLLPDDGDQPSDLLPDDGDDAQGLRRDAEREDDEVGSDAVER
jgi:hypothetical protein